MASQARGVDSCEDATRKTDERLDFFSEKFDPLLALSTPGLRPPKEVKPLDNINKYWSKYNVNKGDSGVRKQQVEAAGCSGEQERFQRRFLPHQMPIKVEKKEIIRQTVLKRMEEVEEGVLGALKKCKEEKCRIKVWTRHSHGLRGSCEAYLTAFDKYWNMSLQDVTETWTRPRRRKITPLVGLVEIANGPETSGLFPAVEIIKADKKVETCKRYVNELLVRGEQVAFIVILQGRQ